MLIRYGEEEEGCKHRCCKRLIRVYINKSGPHSECRMLGIRWYWKKI